MIELSFHPDAFGEFRQAARHYESEKPGLGVRFIGAVEASLLRVQSNPLLFRSVRSNVRKCRVARFPYGIVFSADERGIRVLAVMHLHRDPTYWHGRL